MELRPLPGTEARSLTYSEAKGYEQAYREIYETKTGFPGNVIEPIDKTRQDERGRAHVENYEKAMQKITGAPINEPC